jgi:N-acetylglutamate synthase-like GNAT family acetyltransferase
LVEFTIRSASREDAQAIHALIHTVHINPMGLDWTHFVVAVDPDNNLLGCGQIKLHRDGSRELASIAVVEHRRGLGIARDVIETLLDRESVRPLYLMCRARLEPLYRKFGFHAIEMSDMPPYFLRLSRAERIFNAKSAEEDRLRVMRLD